MSERDRTTKPATLVRYVAEGFPEDFDKLVKSFRELESYKFSDFARLWREASFSLVYMGRQTEAEMREFTQECFFIILNHLIEYVNIHMKVGSLFTLYSMYFKQPFLKYKIRLQVCHWKEIRSLWDYGMREHQLSINYAIHKLCAADAFHFVARQRLMGPKLSVTPEIAKSFDTPLESTVLPKDVIKEQDLDALSDIHAEYQALKAKLPNPEEFMQITDERLQKVIKPLKALLRKEEGENRESDLSIAGPSGTLVSVDDDDVGCRRSRLKQRQFAGAHFSRINQRCKELLGKYRDDDLDVCVDDPTSSRTEGENLEKKVISSSSESQKARHPYKKGKPGRKQSFAVNDSEEVHFESQFNVAVSDSVPLESFTGRKIEMRKRHPKPVKRQFHFAVNSDEEDPYILEEKGK